MGLMPQRGATFAMADSNTGSLVSLYAVMVAAFAVPTTVATSRFGRKPLLLAWLATRWAMRWWPPLRCSALLRSDGPSAESRTLGERNAPAIESHSVSRACFRVDACATTRLARLSRSGPGETV